MEFVPAENVAHQVFLAVDCEQTFLPVGERLLLESLSVDDDGIFGSIKSWKSFINGNFREFGELHLTGTPSNSNVIDRWCCKLNEYKNLFAAQIGHKLYQKVKADDLDFTFEYDCNFYNANEDLGSFPCRVEIYVTATFKQ